MRPFALILVTLTLASAQVIPNSAWHAHGAILPVGISDMMAVTVDDSIYVAGGCTAISQDASPSYYGGCPSVNQTMLVLNKFATKWEYLAPMPRLRYRYAAAAVGPLIYYVGGRSTNDAPVTEIDVFNTTARTWFTLPNQTCNCIPLSDSAAFVIAGKLYVSGGYNADYTPLNSTVVLDTTFPVSAQQFRGDVVPARSWASGDSGAVTVNGIGFVMGGFAYDACLPVATMSAYDPKTNQWTDKRPFLERRGDFGCAAIGKYIYVIGGETKAAGCTADKVTRAVPVADVERYNTDTGLWDEYAPIAFPRFRFPSVAFQDELINIGGQGAEMTIDNMSRFPVVASVYSLNTTTYESTRVNGTTAPASSTGKAGSAASATMVQPIVAIFSIVATIGSALF